jgi:hypothetical protein
MSSIVAFAPRPSAGRGRATSACRGGGHGQDVDALVVQGGKPIEGRREDAQAAVAGPSGRLVEDGAQAGAREPFADGVELRPLRVVGEVERADLPGALPAAARVAGRQAQRVAAAADVSVPDPAERDPARLGRHLR